MNEKNRRKWNFFWKAVGGNILLSVVVLMTFLALNEGMLPDIAHAAEGEATGPTAVWAFVAAALATGLSTLGAGYAVAVSASAALGALSENPDIFGRALIFVGLAEGIAIYGLIVSILILGRV